MSDITKRVEDSALETVHLIRPADLNNAGRLFGGILMQWIDELAGVVARRHAGMPVTTASVDNLQFLHGAYQGDIVILSGKITYVGTTSMEVKVTSYVEKNLGERRLINVAYLTLVGLDENDRPARVPRLQVSGEEEQREWEQADMRRTMRKQQEAQGFHFYGKE
ncbi:MAG: acyl-CoA thioesterase [Lachnospiraceae bacterium]|nr:acyl-CoA thioesterase [Lachnospiraceae bacterium]